jgi:hypothetical protein
MENTTMKDKQKKAPFYCPSMLRKPKYPQGVYIRQEDDALSDFPVGTKLIFCTRGAFWRTLDFCIDCFHGKKFVTIEGIVIEKEDQGDKSNLQPSKIGDVDA